MVLPNASNRRRQPQQEQSRRRRTIVCCCIISSSSLLLFFLLLLPLLLQLPQPTSRVFLETTLAAAVTTARATDSSNEDISNPTSNKVRKTTAAASTEEAIPTTHETPSSSSSSTVDHFKVNLRPLQPLDRDQYTVRINTWKRESALKVAIEHYLTCGKAVAHIQVIWCTAQGAPPAWLLEYQQHADNNNNNNNNNTKHVIIPPVTIELHEINNLNERFNVLQEPITLGILSVDDDVLRPCLALDAGFFQWTANPERMVGYDARGYTLRKDASDSDNSNDKKKWAYTYLSSTKLANHYSFTLTRFSFQHVDYLKSYTHSQTMPARIIRQTVADNLNCEDIAFCMHVSAATSGQAPMLADQWAMRTLYKLPSPGAISGMAGHKATRDDCVEEFAIALDLKKRLQVAEWVHKKDKVHNGAYETGAFGNSYTEIDADKKSARQLKLEETIARWKKKGPADRNKQVNALKRNLEKFAADRGIKKESNKEQKKQK